MCTDHVVLYEVQTINKPIISCVVFSFKVFSVSDI